MQEGQRAFLLKIKSNVTGNFHDRDLRNMNNRIKSLVLPPHVAQGATSGGVLTELVALGALDTYLTLCPSITFWRFRYNKHTNFAMEAIEQPFNGQVAFGSDVQVTLNRTGDLIYFMYVRITLPGICACNPATSGAICGIGGLEYPACDPCDPCGDGLPPNPCAPECPQEIDFDEPFLDDIDACTGLRRPWAHYINAVGQWLIKRACLIIGGQVIDTLYNDYLFMWEELSGKAGKRLQEMIGKRFTRALLVEDSQQDQTLWVPLPFWFTLTPGNALPLVSLQFHGVTVSIGFSDLRSIIQVSDRGILVVKSRDRQPITNNDISASLDTTYIYLDIEERDRFATGCFEQLIVQVQAYQQTVRTSNVRVTLNFNHPIIELIWAVRRRCNEACNNWFNYSGYYGRDPIQAVQLRLNNLARFNRHGKYFRLVQPYQHHSHIPDAFVYNYSFALFPEEPQPSGSINMSRIDNVEMIFTLQELLSNEDVTIIIFGRNWNVFRFREGFQYTGSEKCSACILVMRYRVNGWCITCAFFL